MEPLGKLVFRAWGWMSCRLRVSGKGRCGEDLPTNAGSFQQIYGVTDMGVSENSGYLILGSL